MAIPNVENHQSIFEEMVDKLFFQKLSGGIQSDGTCNFVLPKELTVTITLDEYRRLLAADIEQKSNTYWRKIAKDYEWDLKTMSYQKEKLEGQIEALKHTIQSFRVKENVKEEE